jgi:hypothetical protein
MAGSFGINDVSNERVCTSNVRYLESGWYSIYVQIYGQSKSGIDAILEELRALLRKQKDSPIYLNSNLRLFHSHKFIK